MPRGFDSRPLTLTRVKTRVNRSYCLHSIKFRAPWLALNFSMDNVEGLIRTMLNIAVVKALSFLASGDQTDQHGF